MLCHGHFRHGTAGDLYAGQNVDAVLRDVLGFRFVFRHGTERNREQGDNKDEFGWVTCHSLHT